MFPNWCVATFFSLCVMNAVQAAPSLDITAREEEMDNFVESRAQIKCREHAKLVFDHENHKCINPNNITENGDVVLGALPHMAMITTTFLPFRGGRHSRVCGGALISENFVLTSGDCAHIVHKLIKVGLIYVRLGEVHINFWKEEEETANTTQIIQASQVFLHQKFRKGTDSPYNIGLIQLATPAQLSAFVRPTCLQSGGNLEDVDLIVSFWERVDGDDTHALRAGLSGTRPYKECNLVSAKETHNTYTEVCVKWKNLCRDDLSLVLQTVSSDPHCTYYLVGSGGGGRCKYDRDFEESQKRFFTRIALFIPWIEKIVWP